MPAIAPPDRPEDDKSGEPVVGGGLLEFAARALSLVAQVAFQSGALIIGVMEVSVVEMVLMSSFRPALSGPGA